MRVRSSAGLLLLLLTKATKAHWPHDTIDGLTVSADGTKIYAMIRGMLFRSLNSAISWHPIQEFGYPKYLALSPYDDNLYIAEKTIVRSKDMINFETLTSVIPCGKIFGKERTTTVFTPSGALIAGDNDILYKEDGIGSFNKITGLGFWCPSLSAVPNSDTVYAGSSNRLLRSDNGGETWSLILMVSLEILDIFVVDDDQIFVMTMDGTICYLNSAQDDCIDMGLPDTSPTEKVRDGSSPPLKMSYYDGSLIVSRVNSYAVYYTMDLGDTWNSTNIYDVPAPRHGGQPTAWSMTRDEEITHIDQNFIGTFRGVFDTEDGGITWTYRDTIRKASTTLSISKASAENGGGFTLAVCTYAASCFVGAPNNLLPITNEPKYYDGLFLSPTYDIDGIAIYIPLGAPEFLYGSRIDVPRIDASKSYRVKGAAFSPAFETDNTVFMFGRNVGVVESNDGGQTFRTIFGWGGWDVTRLVISQNYALDGTMACLVDPNLDGFTWSMTKDVNHIYVTNNHGRRWRRLVWNSWKFRDIIIVQGDPKPIVVALNHKGKMYAHTADLSDGWFPFRFLSGTSFSNKRPQGWGNDAMAVSPDGQILASAWSEGGVMYSRVGLDPHVVTGKKYSRYNPWRVDDDIPKVFARSPDVGNIAQARTFTSHIAYSPQFETDRTMFAVDWTRIYKSTTAGWRWDVVFEL